jgi:RHS repeat-associated protein
LIKSVDALQGISTQSFDIDGNRDSLTDPNQNQTQFTFDLSGRLIQETLATGDKVKYTYSARDLLESVTNGRNQQRQFEYDAAGRLTSWTDPDGTVSYSYDGNGNVLTVTDANGTITREYDKLNRVTKYTDTQGNTLQYEYDPVGNLAALTYPDGKQVHYEYNNANQLITVIDWAGRETHYGYDPNARLISTRRFNGTKMTRLYNEAGQLKQQKDVVVATGEIISQFDFKYDAAGNIIEEKTNFDPDPEINLEMTYQAANRLATYNDKTVQFDADGNMTKGFLSGELVNFEFDSRNRLTQAGSTVYRYDAENQRIGVNQTSYVVNSQPALSQVLVRTKGNGEVTYYVYGLGLIGEASAGNYFSYHYDRRGSTVALTDESGQVTERFLYSPYGLLLSGDTNTKTPFLFNGMYGVMTDDNGLYYMRARFYSPEIRRFINQDVLLGNIADGQSLNRFAFVKGKPIQYNDPFGLFSTEEGASVALDFVPIVGSCKGVIEFILGKDPITGEPIPRWMAALGIIPYGKIVTKANKAGEAIVYLYKGGDKHFSIVVKNSDETIHTEQVVTSTLPYGDPMDTTIDYFKDMGNEVRNQFHLDLPDSELAQKLQKDLIGTDTGLYDVHTNSCFTHVCDVLRAGGVDVPVDIKEAYEYLVRDQMKKKGKK